MAATLLFWLALLLPGYVVVRLTTPGDLRSGLLGTIGLSALAVLGILSPVSILAYLFNFPVAVMSAACVLAVVAAALKISHAGWWGDMGKVLIAGIGIELLIILVDMCFGWRVGAFLGGGDERLHIARIRFILEHGFSNLSPFPADAHFFPTYHTNILHAVHAACAQLTGADVLEEWHASLVPAKLLVAAGLYYLTWCVFENRWIARAVAVFAVGWLAPVTYLALPNKLAPFWIVPMMIGFAVQSTQPKTWTLSGAKLALGSLLLGQLHSLYAVFAGIALGPVLITIVLARIARRARGRWIAASCLAGLFAGAPFALIAHNGMNTQKVSAQRAVPAAPTSNFHHFDDGGVVFKPRLVRGRLGLLNGFLVVAGVVCAMTTVRRKQAGVLIAATMSIAAVLFLPTLCTEAVTLFGKEWIVARMGAMLNVGLVTIVIAGILSSAQKILNRAWLRPLVSVALLLLGGQFSPRRAPFDWTTYSRTLSSNLESRREALNDMVELRSFFRQHISKGDTVLADPQSSMWLVMLHDCHTVVAGRGGGIRDIRRRRADTRVMVARNTPWESRRRQLRDYAVRSCMVDTRLIPAKELNWALEHQREPPARYRWYYLVSIETE